MIATNGRNDTCIQRYGSLSWACLYVVDFIVTVLGSTDRQIFSVRV